jgi:hypothetical protein
MYPPRGVFRRHLWGNQRWARHRAQPKAHLDLEKTTEMTHSVHPAQTRQVTSERRVSTETKAAIKTTELVAFVVVTVAMLIASQVADGFDAQHAWLYASLLTIGYMISRGLAKSGSRDYYDDDTNNDYDGAGVR